MARVAAALNEPKDARLYAEEARKYAGRPEETTRVDALLRELGNAAAGAGTPSPSVHPASEPDEDGQRPIPRFYGGAVQRSRAGDAVTRATARAIVTSE